MFEKLFEPIRIRGMEVKNRIVLPAMGTKMAAEDGNVTQQIIDYQVARVKGGCGLNLSEVCAVHAPSAPRKFLALHNDSYIPSHKAFCDAIHEAGGKCGVQLWQGSLAASMDPKARILVASDLHVHGHTIPAVDVETIEEVVACFGVAAKRAVKNSIADIIICRIPFCHRHSITVRMPMAEHLKSAVNSRWTVSAPFVRAYRRTCRC